MNDKMPVAERLQIPINPVDTVDDAELVRRFKSGKESAFTILVKRHQPRLVQMATVLVKDEDVALDIVQDVFVKVYHALPKFRGDSSLSTWLYRILYNRCLTHLRKRKLLSFLSINDDDNMLEVPSKEATPEVAYEQRELKNAIQAALDRLPVRQKMAFSLKQLDDLKFKEIADVMEITEGAAKASYFHAVKKLQAMLKQYGEEYGL